MATGQVLWHSTIDLTATYSSFEYTLIAVLYSQIISPRFTTLQIRQQELCAADTPPPTKPSSTQSPRKTLQSGGVGGPD
jgi:hypothetical protein